MTLFWTLFALAASGSIVEGTMTKMVCEYETMSLGCLDDQAISIKHVDFGRKNAVYCNTNNHWTSRVTNCTTTTTSFNAVSDRCNYRKNCTIPANSGVLGDPCAQVQKYLEVTYDCESENIRKQYACEWERMTITCPTNKKIVINDATYGRNQPTPCYVPGQIVNTNVCKSPVSHAIVASRCEGKQTCTIDVTSSVFTYDPCPRISKFLEVKFVCV